MPHYSHVHSLQLIYEEAGVLDACWNFVNLLETLSSSLRQIHKDGEAEALVRVVEQCLEEKSLGGLGLSSTEPLTDVIREMILLQTEAWLLALNSAENSRSWSKPLTSKPPNRRPMTLAQKIFAHHAIGDIRPEGLKVGDVIRVGVDWIVSSEISWVVCCSLSERCFYSQTHLGGRVYLKYSPSGTLSLHGGTIDCG